MTSIGDVGRAGTVSGGVVRVKSDTYCIIIDFYYPDVFALYCFLVMKAN